MPFSFLDLPFEVREQIYEYLLLEAHEVVRFGAKIDSPRLPVQILRTCKTSLDEASPILYGKNHVWLLCVHDVRAFINIIGLRNASLIKSFLHFRPSRLNDSMFLHHASAFHNLICLSTRSEWSESRTLVQAKHDMYYWARGILLSAPKLTKAVVRGMFVGNNFHSAEALKSFKDANAIGRWIVDGDHFLLLFGDDKVQPDGKLEECEVEKWIQHVGELNHDDNGERQPTAPSFNMLMRPARPAPRRKSV